MTSSARLIVAVLLVGAPAVAAQTEAPVPAPVAARVAEAVAQAWSVSADRLELVWGRRSEAPLAEDTPFRLLGRGADGWWVVVFEPAGAPEAIRLRVGVLDSVPVAVRPLTAGTRLAADDVRFDARRQWGPPASAAERPAPGSEVRRAVAAGEPLVGSAIAPPLTVSAGEPVRFLWSRGGVHVSVEAVALHAARLGESIRGRVEGRRDAIAGVVTAPGHARLVAGGNR